MGRRIESRRATGRYLHRLGEKQSILKMTVQPKCVYLAYFVLLKECWHHQVVIYYKGTNYGTILKTPEEGPVQG
jgi:hypothetical protein